jgi:hypothetical protein
MYLGENKKATKSAKSEKIRKYYEQHDLRKDSRLKMKGEK